MLIHETIIIIEKKVKKKIKNNLEEITIDDDIGQPFSFSVVCKKEKQTLFNEAKYSVL